MPFIESWRRFGALAGLLGVTACGVPRAPAPSPTLPPAVVPVPASPAATARPAPLPLPDAVARARNWDEYRIRAGQRIMAANPNATYNGLVPEPLLAIPVLEIELNSDGSVRRITVKRKPSQAIDTVQLAIDAVQRGAPYGDVSHLPRPWTFTEVFLFRDDRRFKPRALDL